MEKLGLHFLFSVSLTITIQSLPLKTPELSLSPSPLPPLCKSIFITLLLPVTLAYYLRLYFYPLSE